MGSLISGKSRVPWISSWPVGFNLQVEGTKQELPLQAPFGSDANRFESTVDGSEIRLISWYGKYPIIYRVLYIPGGAINSMNFNLEIFFKEPEWYWSEVLGCVFPFTKSILSFCTVFCFWNFFCCPCSTTKQQPFLPLRSRSWRIMQSWSLTLKISISSQRRCSAPRLKMEGGGDLPEKWTNVPKERIKKGAFFFQ